MESFTTSAIVRANGVNALYTNTAVVHIGQFAFIHIFTWHAISLESFNTTTVIGTNGIVAMCMVTAILDTDAAFINNCAHSSITTVSPGDKCTGKGQWFFSHSALEEHEWSSWEERSLISQENNDIKAAVRKNINQPLSWIVNVL